MSDLDPLHPVTLPLASDPDLLKRYKHLVTILLDTHKSLDRFNPKRRHYQSMKEHTLACVEHEIKVRELHQIAEYFETIFEHLNDNQK